MREMSEISADVDGKTLHFSVSDLVIPKMMKVMDQKQKNTHKQNQFLRLIASSSYPIFSSLSYIFVIDIP